MQINIVTILIAIVVFGVLIFIHELGHFLACKASGVRVNEFAMGMGPTIFKFQKGETVYAIRLFPIGGFVAMEGEDEDSEDERSFGNASRWKRLIILIAGSFMNLLLGFVILIVLTSQMSSLRIPQIADFHPGAVSSQWLQKEDTIVSINNHKVKSYHDLTTQFVRDEDGVMDMEVIRNGERVKLEGVTFAMQDIEGMRVMTVDFIIYAKPATPMGVLKYSFYWTESLIKQIWGSLVDLARGRYGINQLSGPVGVTTVIGEASSQGLTPLLTLVAFITVNLGVFNLLPLPALDGGRLLFLLIEAVRRKPLNPKYEGAVHFVGFALLITLMVVVTFNDVLKLF